MGIINKFGVALECRTFIHTSSCVSTGGYSIVHPCFFTLKSFSLVSYASINSGRRVVLAHRGAWRGSIDGCTKTAQTRSLRHAEDRIGRMNCLSRIKAQR